MIDCFYNQCLHDDWKNAQHVDWLSCTTASSNEEPTLWTSRKTANNTNKYSQTTKQGSRGWWGMLIQPNEIKTPVQAPQPKTEILTKPRAQNKCKFGTAQYEVIESDSQRCSLQCVPISCGIPSPSRFVRLPCPPPCHLAYVTRGSAGSALPVVKHHEPNKLKMYDIRTKIYQISYAIIHGHRYQPTTISHSEPNHYQQWWTISKFNTRNISYHILVRNDQPF